MPFERDPHRIVIAGASSLLGAELKSLLEESRFAGADFRLLDEEIAAGTLTEAGGEAAVIQPVEEGSFHRARFVFFTGSADFTRANLGAAIESGARIIDLSGCVWDETETEPWFPKIETLRGRVFSPHAKVYATPSAAGMAASALALALQPLGPVRLSIVFLQPASEAGRKGIEELESQTGHLLSFQSVGGAVFDTQVAFNLLDRFGAAASLKLAAVRDRVRRETKALLDGVNFLPAIQVLHAPVFYGTVLTASVAFDPLAGNAHLDQIVNACKSAGFLVPADTETSPNNVSVAGETSIHLAIPEADSGLRDTWWFWGAADNIRLPAANAVKLAEKLAS
jgi:aspartate-semialdehyde dehydrogenase